MKRTKIKAILKQFPLGQEVKAAGWIRQKRESKNVAFLTLNDGSCLANLQVVVDSQILKVDKSVFLQLTTGASVVVRGELAESKGSQQDRELLAKSIEVLGPAAPEEYPLQPKKHSLEFLREIGHLRPRTNTFGAVFRVRNQLSFAIHQFFYEKEFVYVHTPIITASDAEGAGETFKVTNFDLNHLPKDSQGKVDFTQDFFSKESKLTVSGQLEGELVALALSEIYTFGPTFRAENSNTTRHLSEFWMVEPEMAFYTLEDTINLAEELLQYLIRWVLKHCSEDLAFLEKRASDEDKLKPQMLRSERTLLEQLAFVIDHSFEKISYTDAIEILQNSNPNKKKKFKYPITGWGNDLQSEHERFLVEKHFKKPVVLFDYPKNIKAFYMKQNADNKTVGAMDVLFPGIGEIVGGSQREEQWEPLQIRMKELDISTQEMSWYLDTRKFGTVPHSGFGLGFERLVQFVTGMSNIRDVIPFPRTPGNCDF